MRRQILNGCAIAVWVLAVSVCWGARATLAAEAPAYREELVFPLRPEHNHAPGLVECPNGDLLASWYRGSGERSADNVAVMGARLRKGETKWSDTFLLADTPGFPDCNTCMMIDSENRLWLFWPLILAADPGQFLGVGPHELRRLARLPWRRTAEVGAVRNHSAQAGGFQRPDRKASRRFDQAPERRGERHGRPDRKIARGEASRGDHPAQDRHRQHESPSGRQTRAAAGLADAVQTDRLAPERAASQRPHPAALIHRHVFFGDHGGQ
jgi:hypothetical protein